MSTVTVGIEEIEALRTTVRDLHLAAMGGLSHVLASGRRRGHISYETYNYERKLNGDGGRHSVKPIYVQKTDLALGALESVRKSIAARLQATIKYAAQHGHPNPSAIALRQCELETIDRVAAYLSGDAA